ncbi:hypothetical protein K7X08_035766 [Anisodus acutangulus]|uniref:PGG domain-containing protein n=1 Tax=Anisodus acutangulus TaxID=402998 RepID=A0A9Q1L7M6_9SOLA|nr:hypothetical protein K7X08_035766 [Anisodus acutangulus]
MLKTMSGAEFDAEVAEIREAMVNEVNELGETELFTAAERGYIDVVKELLPYSTKEGITTKNRCGLDPLHIVASQGHQAIKRHTAVVHELLSEDPSLLEISRSNGKNVLHLAARQGHGYCSSKGQTALHMAVKGVNCDVVKLLLQADPAIVMLPDKFGNTALHIATWKKRSEIVHELLLLDDTNVNALTRDHRTALDIAEGLPMSEESTELKEFLNHYENVHNQLEQARKTNKNMTGIAKELQKLHREGINNATNSVTIVASLFATVTFAAIFTVPGGDLDSGYAVASNTPSFKIFYITNALALFTSLAVVVVQITVVRVIGRRNIWAAIFVTVLAGLIMAGVLGAMTYYVVKSKKARKMRKREKFARTRTNSFPQTELSDSDINPMFAL